MYFDGWVRGYKVQIRDWIDGKNIYLNMQEFEPGSSLERKPERELSVLISKEDDISCAIIWTALSIILWRLSN